MTGVASGGKTSPVRVERDGAIAVILIDNPPVNAGSVEVRRALLDAIRAVGSDPAIEGAVLIGAGSTFIAGSDIREFGKPLEDPQLPAVIAAIADCPKPFIAAIHGAALGGGFELALGCDARVATPGSIVGLPEVTLGIIPGAGGTQYLPRLIGVAGAIEMICSARRLAAEEAVKHGLVDVLIEHGSLRDGAVAFARKRKVHKRRLGAEPVPPGDPSAIEKAAANARRAGKNRPHIIAAIDAVTSAAAMPIAEGLAHERAKFQKLRMSTEAAALRYLFFAERQAARVADVEGIAPRPVSRVGIVGAGTMGSGIGICFADAGFPVTLTDKDEEIVRGAVERIHAIYDRSVATGRINAEEAHLRMQRLTPAASLESLEDCDLIIEAVIEDMDVKKDVFGRLDSIAHAGAVLASNTSYLNLDRIAAATRRPESVVGLHFFNPAPAMRLLEIVRGAQTAPETLSVALAIAKRLRKSPVIARMGEGFIGNRIFAAYRRQCEFMLEEGAYPEQVDTALQDFGFAMGPFAVADASGLDTAWRMRQRLAATRDPRERYVEIADRLCEDGRLGQKTGAGWYRYPDGARKGISDPHVHAVIDALSSARGIDRHAFAPEDIRARALVTMVNEAALVLQDGIAVRPSDIDVVVVNGYGFPNYEGGPIFWAYRQDRQWLLSQLDKLKAISGFGFRRGDVEALLDRVAREHMP